MRPPARIYLDVTNACPLRCLHCFSSAGNPLTGELSRREIGDLLDQIGAMKTPSLVIGGGEPLAREDIFDILDDCLKRGVPTEMVTNGVLLDSIAARRLAAMNMPLRLSLDGVSAETHDAIRGAGAFQGALRAATLLRGAGLSCLSIHFTVNRTNVQDLLKLPPFLHQLGIENVVISAVKPKGRAKDNPDLLISPKMAPYVRHKIALISLSSSAQVRQYCDKNWRDFGCPGGHLKMGIAAEGKVTPCVFLARECDRSANIRTR
ncbi:MAG: radical SAM protein, partial [Armatimonadetes bacterium]|nr:radical SAM protein [Armatimonadota bacterium]